MVASLTCHVTQTSPGMECLHLLSTSRQGCPLPQWASAGGEKGQLSRRLHPHFISAPFCNFLPTLEHGCECFALRTDQVDRVRNGPCSLTAHHVVGETNTNTKQFLRVYMRIKRAFCEIQLSKSISFPTYWPWVRGKLTAFLSSASSFMKWG